MTSTSADGAAAALPWPEFRGPTRDGHAPEARPPLEWSEARGVRFRTAIPGTGWSSPVVGAGVVWMTSAREAGRELLVIGVDASTGELLHERVLFEVEAPKPKNALNSFASPSPVVADGRVFVHFGSEGTAALDTSTGEPIWVRRDLPCDHEQGPGSSPVLVDDLLVVSMDGVDHQYVVALDAATGETRWRTARSTDFAQVPPTRRKAYSTPILVEVGGRRQLVSSGAVATIAYDPANGEEIWTVRHGGFSMSSRPIEGPDALFFNTGYMRPELVAVRRDGLGSGDVTEEAVVWSTSRGVPSMSSGIHVDGRIYLANENGMLTALDAASGERVWQERVGGKFYASPVYAGGRLYFADREGSTIVLAPGDTYRPLAVNRLESGCMASPAVVGDALFLRTVTHLYRIERVDPDVPDRTSGASGTEAAGFPGTDPQTVSLSRQLRSTWK